MRRYNKRKLIEDFDSLFELHDRIGTELKEDAHAQVSALLARCQETAILAGNRLEEDGGSHQNAVRVLEEYCEALYLQSLDLPEYTMRSRLDACITQVREYVRQQVNEILEVVFLPYKASMWDSLESVYLAAKKDPGCRAYCVPIPYFDLNADGSFGRMNYEGGEYPEDIEVIDWQSYRFEERRPDVIYIHNPYDNWNRVTSVHPRYYSANLKKYTDTLVYIPYYCTSGGMNEAQSLCPAYLNADYIVIQSPKFRDYFDESIPDKKFLPFGSPKFDRVIRKCQNPPNPPVEWQEKRKGKKVYFYNTSINGMLADTENFLKKMEYVFKCFKGKENACLLWRPHPLLESTFDSMRLEYRPVYDALKKVFIDYNLGIYDDTPDVTDSIALSDAYIGDEGSSVVALFGVAGKPIFVLNNRIHSAPKEDSWRGELGFTPTGWEQDKFVITQNNKLYCSEALAYDYKFKCDLSMYMHGTSYGGAYEINGKIYVYPRSARDILVIGSDGIEKRISLKNLIQKDKDAFSTAWKYDRYLILIPFKYPAIVRYNTESGELSYLFENIDTFVKKNEQGQTIVGGTWLYNGILYISSPTGNCMFRLDIENYSSETIILPEQNSFRCCGMMGHNGKFWMFPAKGKKIVCWDSDAEETKEFSKFPDGFQCIDPVSGQVCDENLFGSFAIYGDDIYLSPLWANMYIKLNTITGELSEWRAPFEDGEGGEYFYTTAKNSFLLSSSNDNNDTVKVFSQPKRKLYEVNTETNAYREIEIKFDIDELRKNESGFCTDSEKLKYCCRENAFNSLECFLDGKITGNQYDISRQREEYKQIVANFDGNCGVKLHEFISEL